jgi:hypothetical protein
MKAPPLKRLSLVLWHTAGSLPYIGPYFWMARTGSHIQALFKLSTPYR